MCLIFAGDWWCLAVQPFLISVIWSAKGACTLYSFMIPHTAKTSMAPSLVWELLEEQVPRWTKIPPQVERIGLNLLLSGSFRMKVSCFSQTQKEGWSQASTKPPLCAFRWTSRSYRSCCGGGGLKLLYARFGKISILQGFIYLNMETFGSW